MVILFSHEETSTLLAIVGDSLAPDDVHCGLLLNSIIKTALCNVSEIITKDPKVEYINLNILTYVVEMLKHVPNVEIVDHEVSILKGTKQLYVRINDG